MRISTRQMHDLSVNSMLDRQAGLSHTQLQMSTGKRVLQPSDDPVSATQTLALSKAIDITERYQDNISYVKNRLGTQEGLLDSVGNVLQRVRELTVQGNNTHLSDPDRKAIAAEVRQRLTELMGQANSKDANGEYIFGGFKAQVPPIVYDSATQSHQYQGDAGQRELQIGPTYFMNSTDSGEDIFMRIRNGNGDFATSYDPANSGTGVIDGGLVYDKNVLTYHDYRVDFVAPLIPGDPIEYTVTDVTTGVAVIGAPPAAVPFDVPQPYVEGAPIRFTDGVTEHGIEVSISGTPVVGDGFTIEASRSQDIFTTIDKLATTLETQQTNSASAAKIRTDMYNSLEELDNAISNILDIRADLGARLNAVDGQEYLNEGYVLQMKETRSYLEDLDYAEATGRLNRELVGLQAAQQVYMKVQGLSLFNFMR